MVLLIFLSILTVGIENESAQMMLGVVTRGWLGEPVEVRR